MNDQRPDHVRIREIHPLDALTALVLTLRPDWPPDLVRTTLANDGRPYRLAIPAAIDAALDPNVNQPGGIRRYQPRHSTAGPTPTPPDRAHACPTHPGWPATGCGGCRADLLATPTGPHT